MGRGSLKQQPRGSAGTKGPSFPPARLPSASAARDRQEAQYRRLFRSDACPMFLLDLRTLFFLEVNAAAVGRYGYSQDDFRTMTIEQFWSREDVPRVQAFVETLRGGAGGPLAGGIWKHRRTDGTAIDVHVSAVRADLGERPAALILATDLERRKDASESPKHLPAVDQLVRRATIAMNDAVTPEGAVQACLDEICASMDWVAGHFYRHSSEEGGRLVPAGVWHLEDPVRLEMLRSATETRSFGPGEGLPGRALASSKPEWIADMSEAAGFQRRSEAVEAGLAAALCLPVGVGPETVGVLEFFSAHPMELEDGLLAVMVELASRMGRAVERLRAREELDRSEERFQLLARATNDAVWDWDLTTNQVWWGEGVGTLFGYSPERIWPDVTWWLDRIHPDDRQRVLSEIQQVIHSGGWSWSGEYRYLRADGCYAHVHDRGYVIRDEDSKPVRMIGAMLDISERKRAEALLSGEKKVLEMIARGDALGEILDVLTRVVEKQIEEALCSVLLLDHDGLRLRLGAARTLPESYIEAIDGLSIGPGVGSCGTAAHRGETVIVSDIAVDPHWSDLRDLALRHGLRSCWSTPIFSMQRKILGTFAIYHPEPRRPAEESLQLMERAADLAGIAIERTQTEEALRESERRYRTVFEESRDAIFITSRQGRFIDANETALTLFGYSREEMFDLNAWDLYLNSADRHSFQEEIEGRGSVRDYDVKLVKKDGSVMDCLHTATIWRSVDGSILGYQGIVRDITEQKQSVRTLRHLTGRLMQAQDQERRRIARELHDSVGQSLAAVAMNLSVVKGARSLDDRQSKALEASLALAEECTREIRTLSHLLHPPLMDEIGLGPAVRWYAEGFAARSGVNVQLRIPPDLGRMPQEVEIALFRIMQESLANIHRHSGSPTACIRLERDAQRVLLEVEDQGRGMAPRVSQRRGGLPLGLGVGVAGMYERVKQLGGRLEIDSDGRGTRIRATLPAGQGTTAPEEQDR